MMSLQPVEVAKQLELRRNHLTQMPHSIREGRLKRVSGIVLEVEGLRSEEHTSELQSH